MTRRIRILLTVSVLAVLVALAGVSSPQAGKKKKKKKTPSRVGVIIALGVGHNYEAQPSFKMVQRVATAVRAYKSGRAKYLLFCGGHTSGHVAEAQEMKVMALAMGVPPRAILVEDGSITTVENARNAELIIKKKRFRSALLVTHRGHLPRATKAFKKIRRLKRVRSKPADDYTAPKLDLDLEHTLPPFKSIQAVVVHGKSKPVDFRGDTVTLDKVQNSLARTAAFIFQQGLNRVPYYIWHPAFGVGHVTRAEIIGLAAIAHGLPAKYIRYGVARRFAPNKKGLFETCLKNDWKRVLAVLPAKRADEVELIEQQYHEHGIEATVITAGKIKKR